MRKNWMWLVAGFLVLSILLLPLFAQQQGGRGGQQTGAAPPRARAPMAVPQPNEDPLPKIPVGFTSIFNGKDLSGWHVSKTNHHGTTPDYHVRHGILMGTQEPFGKGGILMTDRKYKNVEVYMEVKPDWGCDSGLFFWTDADGGGYQVMLDYLPGGTMAAGVYGERLTGVNMDGPGWETLNPEQRQEIQARRTEAWQRAWKREQWNAVRARIEGNPPRITAWLNDEMVFRGTDTANHATNGATEGSIAIQIHGGERWRPGGFWRWRVIAVKELPN